MPTHANALVVMAKAPFAGQVKTRLVPPLTPEEAAELCRALLLDLLEGLRHCQVADLFLAFTPAEAAPLFAEIVPSGLVCFPQRGDDLGERMNLVFEDLFIKGYRNIVLIGGDLPGLPSRFLEEAFRVLEQREQDLVLGPSRDGGYYLVGLSRSMPEIFNEIPWGGENVLMATTQKLTRLGLKAFFLPPWFDIDTPEDLQYLESVADQIALYSHQKIHGFLKYLAAKKSSGLGGKALNR